MVVVVVAVVVVVVVVVVNPRNLLLELKIRSLIDEMLSMLLLLVPEAGEDEGFKVFSTVRPNIIY